MYVLKALPTKKILENYAEKYPELDVEKTATATRMLRQASLFIRELDAYFSECGLSQMRFFTLLILDREPEIKHFTMADLVQRLDVSKPIITNTVKALEKEGYVSISICEQDARAKLIAITDEGRRKLSEVLPGYYTLVREEMEATEPC
jgi:DNA-binding MarR family transcriptional regulator